MRNSGGYTKIRVDGMHAVKETATTGRNPAPLLPGHLSNPNAVTTLFEIQDGMSVQPYSNTSDIERDINTARKLRQEQQYDKSLLLYNKIEKKMYNSQNTFSDLYPKMISLERA